jgi:hypothetical protein
MDSEYTDACFGPLIRIWAVRIKKCIPVRSGESAPFDPDRAHMDQSERFKSWPFISDRTAHKAWYPFGQAFYVEALGFITKQPAVHTSSKTPSDQS